MHNKLVIIILALSFFLRVFALTTVPPSLYWEEAALGYDAYSILKTAKDHHGHLLPFVAFESFGDYKPAIYFYAIVPFIIIFGLSPLAVRLPSAIAGVLIVFFVGKITQQLIQKEKKDKKRSWFSLLSEPDILAMIATSLSPWALQFSRSGWEVNLATCFLVVGVYAGLLGIKQLQITPLQKSAVFFKHLLCVLFLVLSAYTYHSTRFIAPMVGLVLVIPLILRVKTHFKEILALGLIAGCLMLPILLQARNPEIMHRLQETSAFTTQYEVMESNALIQQFGSNRLAKIVFHRYFFYAKTFATNLFSHFRLDYLFLTGDNNTRHSIHFFGLLFPTDIILLSAASVALFYSWKKRFHFLWLWLLIALIPAALTKDTPHALRTLPAMPIYMVMLGLGASKLLDTLKKLPFSRLLILSSVSLFILQVIIFWHYYLFVYPVTSALEWQYGYQQMIEAVNKNVQPEEKVYITTEYGRPAMYYWFFSKTDPSLVQLENDVAAKDQAEFKTFKNFSFVTSLSGTEHGLVSSTPLQRERFAQATELAVINDLQGKPLWIIYRTP